MSQPKTRKDMLLDEKWISTPDMGEYLDSSMIMKAAEEIAKGKVGGEYFIEKPFSTIPGYHSTENVVILSGKPSFLTNKDEIANTGRNRTDGDTVYLDFDEIIDGGELSVFNNTDKPMTPKQLLKHAYESKSVPNGAMLGVRVLGIDAPELPHFREFDYEKKDKDGKDIWTPEIVKVKYKDLLAAKSSADIVKAETTQIVMGTTTPKTIYIKKAMFAYSKYNPMTDLPTPRDPELVLHFLPSINKEVNFDTGKVETGYYEILETPVMNDDGSPSFKKEGKIRIIISHGADDDAPMKQFEEALAAQREMFDKIKNASNVIYMLDQTYLANKARGSVPYDYKKEYEKISSSPIYAFKSLYNNLTVAGNSAYQQVGKRFFGQELNGRYLGAIYIEEDTDYGKQWINLAKYLLYKYPSIKALPSYTDSGATDSEYSNVSDAFKLWSYDNTKQVFLDKINAIGTDDRDEVQKKLTGVDLTELTSHTVMIGDCLLMIPPTSIRTVTQTRSERITMIRSKGGLTKSLPKTERILEMQLFFNGEDAINGIPFEQATPSGQKLKYHMNGLRSLIAQYKFTPFLPIHNDYINYVLNIEAVSLVSIQVTTVPNYPKTLQATIKLQEFDYRQYMPEILPPDAENKEDLYTNLFARVIHWPVFRYYYQKSIRAGEQLSDMLFDSEPYTQATVGQKTSLQNMKFMTPTFELFVANEEMLKQRKMVKQSLERNPIESVIKFNPKEEAMLKKIASMFENLTKGMASCYSDITDVLLKPKPVDGVDLEAFYYRGTVDKDKIHYETAPAYGIYYGSKEYDKVGRKYYYKTAVGLKEVHEKCLIPIKNKLVESLYGKGVDIQLIKEAKFAMKQIANEITWKDGDVFETTYKFGMEIEFDWGSTGSSMTLDKVRRLIAKANGVLVGDVFKDGKVFVGWTSIWALESGITPNTTLKNNSSLRQDTGSNDYKSIAYLCSAFGLDLNDSELGSGDDMWTGPSDIGDMKDNIDLETAKSIKYDYYDIGNPIINNITLAYNNIFNNMSMKIYDGYASQFTGGTDTSIEINMTATNEYTVNKLQAISRVCAQRLIDFRKILASSPLRINCEMTRFMGVNEVIIESIDITTVPNFPGTWNVSMSLTSVDRTLRNREAMKKIDEIKNVEINMDSAVKTKNFFDVKNTLAKVELYPDLELPTIAELEKLGFYYIKYKSSSSRVFPDADFYFSYLHVFSSEMLKEAIVKFFQNKTESNSMFNYSGDLFENDSAVIKWNLDIANPKKLSKEEIAEEAAATDTSFPNVSNQESTFGKSNYTETSSLDAPKRDAISSISRGTVPEELAGASAETKKLYAKAQKVNEVVFGLREAMECTNFDSYDFNAIHKVSVKSNIPYSQEKSLLTKEKLYRKYLGNNKFESVLTKNIADDQIDSLKAIILEILSSEIPENAKKPSQSDFRQYRTLYDYIAVDILGSKNLTELFFRFPAITSRTFTFLTELDVIMDGCARGATASTGVIEQGDTKHPDTLPKQFIPHTTYEIDQEATSATQNNKPAGDVDVVSGGKPEVIKKPVKTNIPNILYPIDGQGLSTFALAVTPEEQEKGVLFGMFGIKKYNPAMLSNIYGLTFVNAADGFLDPYYNPDLSDVFLGKKLTKEEASKRTKAYVSGLTKGIEKGKTTNVFAENAFFRNMLVWLYKMLSDNRKSLLPDTFFLMGEMTELLEKADEADDNWFQNIWPYWSRKYKAGQVTKGEKKEQSSSFSSDQKAELDETRLQVQLLDEETKSEKELEKMKKDLKADIPRMRLALMNGLFLSLGSMAMTDFNTPVYTAVKGGDLGSYVSYIERIKGSYIAGENISQEDMQITRLFQYVDSQFDTSANYDHRSLPYETDIYSFQGKQQRLYLEAAENPSVYLMHSFYDMVMNDMRGRMARAFPTYYMLLIDEGRDLGVWRLQDNFYDVSSITEFQVVKSRKIAADTAKIVMTNLFGTFTTEDDDMKDEYQYTFRDMWNSVFSPQVYVKKEYQRYSEARDINRAKIVPGARVNLRMGYSADASSLPIMFNGSVAEVIPGDLMTVVCQGDGTEIANPAMFNATDAKDVADLKYNDSLISGFLGVFENTTTPRDILLNPLIAEGNWIHEVVKDWSEGRLFNSNPFGVTHFGDKHFKKIFINNGEPEQNIYEALNRPSWGRDVPIDSSDYSYSLTSAPKIKVGLIGNRSYWDLMHIAASVSPDFICAVVPFQMRSSIFYGAARYYCAYDYDRLPNGQLVEKRKPFQQYHIYTSYTDIISNGVSASDKEMATCAVGIYEKPGNFTGKSSASVGPLYLDIDIYPENQKMTTINCNFEYINFDLIPFTIPVLDAAMNELSDTGGYQIAWRATANGLRESVKDMYSGELIVIGDPTVKPYDKIFINDIYEDMQGMVDVETVVHTFSSESGFTTSITPDCISSIDNKYEQIAHSTIKELVSPVLATHAILCGTSAYFSNISRSMFYAAERAMKFSTGAASKATNSIVNVMGKDNISPFTGFSDEAAKKFGLAFGVTNLDYTVFKSVSAIDAAYSSLGITRKLEKSTDLVRFVDDLIDLEVKIGTMNPAALSEALQQTPPSLVPSKEAAMAKARQDAIGLQTTYDKTAKNALSNIKFSEDDIKVILKSADANLATVVKTEDLKDAIKLLEGSKGIKYVDNIDDISKELRALQSVLAHTGDLTGDANKVVKIFNGLDKSVFKATQVSLKGFDSVTDTFKSVNSIKKGFTGIKAVALTNILWLVAEIVITKSVQEFLERKLKNWQVLTVFPLMKNGIVYTAGLNGSKGSVFGSPTYNRTGWLEQQAINFFDYKGTGMSGTVLTLLRDMFITTDEMLLTVNGYKRDNGFGKVTGSSEVTRQSEISDLLDQVAKNNISGFNAYRKLYFDARVESSKSEAAKAAYRKYRLVNIFEEELLQTKVIADNLVPVAVKGNLISKLSEQGVFKFVGEQNIQVETATAEFSSDNYIMLKGTEGGGSNLKVPCKKITSYDKDNSNAKTTVFVLPYLRPDAAIALEMVVEKICERLQPDYLDAACKFEYLKKNNIVLHNGVMINEKSWMSTGFGFILEVKNSAEFSNIIDEINKVDESISKDGAIKFKLLHIEKDKLLSKETYDFWVAPRKI